MMRKKAMRALLLVGLLAVMISMCSMTAFAAGDVAGAMALISEVEYQRIFRLQVEHYDPQKKLCLVP